MDNVTHPDTAHGYITTVSGVNIGVPGVDFLPHHVRNRDITRALALTCRFLGHLDTFYSVAEHSLLVCDLALAHGDTEAAIPALMHDAHEAYMGDIASPQKKMIEGAAPFERAMEAVVREALGLPTPEDPVWERVRTFDILMLHREVATLRNQPPDWYSPNMDRLVPPRIQPVGLDWQRAEAMLAQRMDDFNL